jgi:DNA (cytosine-5)-methyltransferase 1
LSTSSVSFGKRLACSQSPIFDMPAYYNENNPFAAEWLRQLIKAGAIAPGDVDERSIEDVAPTDLAGYTQCHFFAGIGVWSYALRLAGWPDDRPIWTGSPPCQPFSAAGRRKGFSDSRHLWPVWYRLIRECRPVTIVGEQVAGKAGLAWLDAVSTDLEAAGYAVGAVDFCAAGVGAPHIRQRLYWLAHADGEQFHRAGNLRPQRRDEPSDGGGTCRPAHAWTGRWREVEWIRCRDGKTRTAEPGTFPLADGAPARVGRLRGYGNAIVAPQAAAFIEAVMEII